MSAYRSPVVGAAAGLLGFYWGAGFLYWLWSNDWYFNDNWGAFTLSQLEAILGGCVLGVGFAGLAAYMSRKMALLKVAGDSVSGVSINLGAMPMPPGPKAAEGDLDLSGLRLPEGVSRWHESWLPSMLKLQESGQKKGKVYVDLVVAIMKVLAAHGDVPAGVAPKKKADQTKATDEEDEGEEDKRPKQEVKRPVERFKAWWQSKTQRKHPLPDSGMAERPHGGHTLLEHSYSVASMALQVAKSWSFEDAVEQWNRSERIRGTYRKIGKKNGSYVFRKSDELVPIIALAHDLGKIKTFKQKGDGTWYTAREDHDSLSAQMLMRIPEFWKLPRRERRITLLVVSTYHRDAELRRHVEHVGYEDRIFALLQLLIVADKAAGMLEEGKKSSEEQEVAEKDEEEDWRPKVWTAFTQLINQANRIAPKHNQYRIGQKSVVGKDKPMIILNEMSVRKELERMLPKECLRYAQTRVGGDVNGLTALLLETLDKHGVLVKQWGGFVTAPTSAIWQVEFHGRDKEKQGPIAKWKFSILVDPTEKFQNICEMPNADSVPRIEGPTGNRNEGLGFGEPGAESGISPDWEFEGEDDGNVSHDPDEAPVPPPGAENERAGSSIFSQSTFDNAVPEAAPEAKLSIDAAKGGKKRAISRSTLLRKGTPRARGNSNFGDGAETSMVNEFEDPVPTKSQEPKDVQKQTRGGVPSDPEFYKLMQELALEVTAGRVMGTEVVDDGAAVLVPYKQATQQAAGAVLMLQEVMQKVAANAYTGVRLVRKDDGVYVKLVVKERA